MKCPICDVDLLVSERQNVEIDYCPKCRGIWLDRGELDKIIEKSMSESSYSRNRSYGNNEDHHRDYDEHRYDKYEDRHHDDHDHYDGHYKKKKKNFISDLFDF